MIYKSGKNYYIGWLNKFQGLGFIISLDNPPLFNGYNYLLIEIKFLYFVFWYAFDKHKSI